MPLADGDRSRPCFRQQDFADDPAVDRSTCPGSVPLTDRGGTFVTRVHVYQAPTAACQACALRSRCTDSQEGRTLNRPVDEAYREQARQHLRTPASVKSMRTRGVIGAGTSVRLR